MSTLFINVDLSQVKNVNLNGPQELSELDDLHQLYDLWRNEQAQTCVCE